MMEKCRYDLRFGNAAARQFLCKHCVCSLIPQKDNKIIPSPLSQVIYRQVIGLHFCECYKMNKHECREMLKHPFSFSFL